MLTSNIAAARSNRPTLVASIISVNGSARTAKLATIARLKDEYRKKLQEKQTDDAVQELKSLLTVVQNID
jgi:predicted house-cleaning noncanonical NTP pyrophosphatase (MazG superfamily)